MNMDTEQLSQLRRYAWGYFSVHADQLLKTFNFYAVLSTAIVAGILAIAKDATNPAVAAPLAFLLSFLSFIFWKLDQRNRQLIKHGENALKHLEREIEPSTDPSAPHILQIFRYEENATNALSRFPKTWWLTRAHFSYSTCFNSVFFVFGFGGAIVGCVLLLWKVFV
jgi:hypothetical protein